MPDTPATSKDFGPISEAYAFFQSHATELENDAHAHANEAKAVVPDEGPIRLLDFGSGDGTLTARFLELAAWPPERLHLALTEPAEAVRKRAVERLRPFTAHPIADAPAPPIAPPEAPAGFDLVLSNHSLYYVPDLEAALDALLDAPASGGTVLISIAGTGNVLVGFWLQAFAWLGQPVPYHSADNVAVVLHDRGVPFKAHQIPYTLSFDDTQDNRMLILRFLLADHLGALPEDRLLALFDPHVHDGRVVIETGHEQFILHRN